MGINGVWRVQDIVNYELSPMVLVNSADSDEMAHFAAFHLDFYCLPKYLFMCFQ